MIKVQGLTRIFSKGKSSGFGIENVSFTINDGDVVAFVGDNGAGKTTTIKAIFGEVRLQAGNVFLNGEDLHQNNNLQNLAFFPDSNNVPLNMKVDEYVRYLCAANGIPKAMYEANAVEIYTMLDLNAHRNKKIKELSAGLKKRAIMASVLIRGPKYIFLDEPTANLDVESKLEFIQILRAINKLGVTILITSHIIEELQEIANHLVLIANGRIVYDESFDGTKERMIDIYRQHTAQKKVDLGSLVNVFERGAANSQK